MMLLLVDSKNIPVNETQYRSEWKKHSSEHRAVDIRDIGRKISR